MKKNFIIYLLSLFLLFYTVFESTAVFANASVDSRRDFLKDGSDYTAILYDSSNGLPTSEANAIVQSGDGFIWIGGYSGLIRYDGSTFTRFDSSTGISSVFSLYVDSSDRVWIGTNENGVALYDHGDLKVYGRVEGLKSYSIRAIIEDPNGNILLGTTDGLACIDSDTLEIHVIDDPQINFEYITELVKDSAGNIYGLTLSGAVFEISDLRVSAFYDSDKFGGEHINSLYADPVTPGLVYMGSTESYVFKVNLSSSLMIVGKRSVAPQKNINSMLIFNDMLWITSTNGIGFFDEKSNYTELSDIPMNSSVGNILSDHEGNLWFTSTRQGVMKLVPDRFTDLSKMIGLDQMVINSTCINGNYLYLATDKGLKIVNLDSYALIENDLTEYLDGVRIRCIKNDSANHLWLCTHGDTGLVSYDPETRVIQSFNEENGLDAERVRTVMQRHDGSMVAATGNGIFIIKRGYVTAHYGHDSGINNTEILSVEEGPDNKLYLGTDGDGIYVIDGEKVSRIGFEDGLTSGVIMRIKYDETTKMFWLVTSNSLQYMQDSKLEAVTNFPYSNNYDIFFNNDGDAWVLSSNGIYITKTSELLDNKNIEYTFYNIKSGLPYITTGNSRNYLDGNGNLYISGTTGVFKVNINAHSESIDSALLAIPSIEVDGKIIPLKSSDTIRIPAGSKRVVVNAYALTYGLSNPRVCYYLEGFDQDPIYTTKQDLTPVVYTNLDGGRYVFHLSIIDNTTGEISKSLSVNIIKESSIYESIWFWLALTLFVIAFVIIALLRRFHRTTSAMLKKQEEDEKFINQIIHTFAKCVDMRDSQNRGHSFRVAYYTKLLAQKLAPMRGYTKEQIAQFYNIALMHDIGKLSIPDSILNKPERLNDEEYEIMKSHAAKGAELLKDVTIVKDLSVGAGCHHERMDGRGYPNGLKADEIPDVAKIIAVADTFDAMYSTRPYRKQLELSVVLDELNRIRGSQLDPDVVDALMELSAEGKLDKSLVDSTVEEAPTLEKMPSEKGQERTGDTLSKDNGHNNSGNTENLRQVKEDEDFLRALGFK